MQTDSVPVDLFRTNQANPFPPMRISIRILYRPGTLQASSIPPLRIRSLTISILSTLISLNYYCPFVSRS